MIRSGLCLLLTALPLAAADLSLPSGAALTFSESRGLTTYRVATGPHDGNLPTTSVDGAVLRQIWQIPANGRTPLQIQQPIQADLEAAGYEVVFSCETRGCGGFDFRFDIDVAPAPDMFVNLAGYRYLAARKDDAWVVLLTSRTGEMIFLQETRIGAPDDLPAVKSTSDAAPTVAFTATSDVTRALVENGRAVLSDLEFATGSTALTADRYASLDALADFLRANPETTIALVGHTDAEGGAAGNMAISKTRADSAKALLTGPYGIAAGRVETHGVGFFAPITRNDTEAGREANRRVEVVITSTQ